MHSFRTVVASAQEYLDLYGELARDMVEQRTEDLARQGLQDEAQFLRLVLSVLQDKRHDLTPNPLPLHTAVWPRDAVFDAMPQASLLLNANLTIAGVNRAYLDATMTRRRDIVGCDLFDVFPDNPDDSDADGELKLSVSLARVIELGSQHVMKLQRYDIRDREGRYEERWWLPTNTPVLDERSRLSLIIHQVRDVTSLVRPRALALAN